MSTDPRFALAADGPHVNLTAAELTQRLDYLLSPVLSARRSAAPLAQALEALERAAQDFTLRWVEIISRTNHELAYQFVAAAPRALAAFDADHAKAWIIHAVDTYDRDGLYAGSEVFRQYDDFGAHDEGAHVVEFQAAAPILERYLCGLAGRRLKLDMAPVAWTDSETLYLPPRMAAAADREGNFLLYKLLVTLLWAQNRYGTFNADLDAALGVYPEPARALAWFNFLETLRLNAHIARFLPGLARDAAGFTGEHDGEAQYAPLRAPNAGVEDCLALLARLDLGQPAPQHAWMGVLRLAEARARRESRIAREKDALQAALSQLLDVQNAEGEGEAADSQSSFEAKVTTDADGEAHADLFLGDKPLAAPKPVRELLDSIVQDLGEIPDDYLTPQAGHGDTTEGESGATDDAIGAPTHFYPEWDFQRGHYRKNWCALRELDVIAADHAFVDATLVKYAPQVAQLRRTFELLRGEDRLMKRMRYGDDVDLDAVVAAYSDMRCGRELSERLFVKRHKAERDLAVMFMVDMSGSTKGWINEACREALVLLAQALQVLGDRYAIYGFSGMTRKRCEIFRVKRFDEAYSEVVQQRISAIAPQDYTRMGAAIRHLTALFDAVDARTKLLITLSDGKPDDYSDNYRGEYGIEDTRQALFEAHRAGIKPFCITIDSEARDYLPHMYGAANWTLVDDVSRLPLKVAEIYRKITT